VGAVDDASNGAGRGRRDANDGGAARESARAGAKVDGGADTAAAPRDRMPAATSSSSGVAPQAAWASAMDAASGNDASQTTVKLPLQSPTQWRQPLTEALGDKLQWQLNRNSEQATIRLDPPMLGRIEISIRHEAGALQVQLSATNSEVLRQLHGIGDNLRHDLSQRQTGEVAVTVTDASRDAGRDLARDANAQGQGRGRDRDAQGRDSGPGRALAEAEADSDSSSPFSLARE
jgi:flagellar hook-length control protein FliK